MMIAALALAVGVGSLHTAPCSVGANRTSASCGSFTVFEDRFARKGRKISLHFVLLKAKHPSGHVIAFNPGGPGGSAIADAPLIADGQFLGEMATLRDRYDVLLLDNRGTGESGALNCDIAPLDRPYEYFAQGLPDRVIEACRKTLARRANLSLYSTTAAIGDLDDLRQALGYRKLVLDGGSYGTRLYLAYARAYPSHVESLILRGVVPPHFVILPLNAASGFQSAIAKLFAECHADRPCSRRYPEFEQHFKDVASRFDRGPVAVPLWIDGERRFQMVQLSKDVFFARLLEALYEPDVAAYLPVIIEHAYRGDYMPLSLLIEEIAQQGASSGARGLNLSVVCAEDIPFLTESAIASTSVGTFQGDARVRALQHACGIWNVHPVSSNFVDPVRTNAPILMIDGTDDPVTPPVYAREALPYLPNAHLMIVRGGSHDSDSPCIDAIADRFVRQRTAAGLNLGGCAASYQRPPFATTLRYYQVGTAPTDDATTRFKSFLARWAQGYIDRSQLTPAVSKEYSSADAVTLADQLASVGRMYGFELLESQRTKQGRTYKWIVRYQGGLMIATIALDRANRISAMDLSG